MTEWQTIDSAPKDGTEILVFNSLYKEMFVALWHDESWQYAVGIDSKPIILTTRETTHWMPLPEPPDV